MFPEERPGSFLATLGRTWNPNPIIGLHYFGDFQSITRESNEFDQSFNYESAKLDNSPFTYFIGLILYQATKVLGFSATYLLLVTLAPLIIYFKTFSFTRNFTKSITITCISLLSSGFLFSIDRGNFWLIAGIFIFIGTFTKWETKRDKLLLLLAAAIKPTLFFLLISFTFRQSQRWKDIAMFMAVFTGIQVASIGFLFLSFSPRLISQQLFHYFLNLFGAFTSRTDVVMSYPSPPNHLGVLTAIKFLGRENGFFQVVNESHTMVFVVFSFSLVLLLRLALLTFRERANHLQLLICITVLITYLLGGQGYALIILVSAITLIFVRSEESTSSERENTKLDYALLALCTCPIYIPIFFEIGSPNILTFIIPLLTIFSLFLKIDTKTQKQTKNPSKKNN